MKKSLLIITVLLVFPVLVVAQDNASLWENEASISGASNSVLGVKAGASTKGKANVYIGTGSGSENSGGSGNVFLGYLSGIGNGKGSGNVFLGHESGASEGGSNLLYIENTKSNKPLIWGRFDKDIVNINGHLGVQNNNPQDALDVMGNIRSNAKFVITSIGALNRSGNDMHLWSVKNLYLGSGSSNKNVAITNSGNVGIGTITPDEKLAVNGKIHAKEVRVDLNGWPDYVFEETYELPSLKEVEQHILLKGHLHNIPPAKEVESKGIQLGEMNAKLLEKIEELTLYTIQQQKELNIQKEKNNTLEERLVKLESLIKE